MRAQRLIIIICLLFTATFTYAGGSNETSVSYGYLLTIFFILDVLFGFFLIFGKFIRLKRKENRYTFLKSQQS